MRAVLCHDFTGPAGLTIGETDPPVCADDEIIVDVHAASVSYMDYLIIAGGYQLRPPTPFPPGTDCAGIVARVGADVTRFKPGDRVVGSNWVGAFAEQAPVKDWRAVHLPDGIDFVPASTVLHVYGTAYNALVQRGQLKAGETLFVSGASGGVGLAVIDLAKMLGATVIAGVGSDGKEDLLTQNGADAVIHYGQQDLRERIKELTDGRGVDVAVDNIGGDVFSTLSRVMTWGGRLMPVGFTSGEIPKVAMNLPLLKGYSIVGVNTGVWQENHPEEVIKMGDEVMGWLQKGKIRPYVDKVLPLERAPEALQAIADRQVRGRVVIKVR